MLSSNEALVVEQNLFPYVRSIVRERPDFPWHRDRSGSVSASRVISSQALAVDLFETVNRLEARDFIVGAWLDNLEIPLTGPWRLATELPMDRSLLGEPRPTQVDALAEASHGIVLFECKFCEPDGGSCSQPKALTRGAHKGQRQCNGNYESQINPITGEVAHCALSGKGVRYWQWIPDVISVDPEASHRPCPFAGGWYQWMRNLVVARALADKCHKTPAFVIVYADGNFPMAKKVGQPEWRHFLEAVNGREVPLRVVSYQSLLDEAISATAGKENALLQDLKAWIVRKIADAENQQMRGLYWAGDPPTPDISRRDGG